MELKNKDNVVSNTSITTTAAIYLNDIHVIAQGTGDNERAGRIITIKKINIRYKWNLGQSANSTTQKL